MKRLQRTSAGSSKAAYSMLTDFSAARTSWSLSSVDNGTVTVNIDMVLSRDEIDFPRRLWSQGCAYLKDKANLIFDNLESIGEFSELMDKIEKENDTLIVDSTLNDCSVDYTDDNLTFNGRVIFSLS